MWIFVDFCGYLWSLYDRLWYWLRRMWNFVEFCGLTNSTKFHIFVEKFTSCGLFHNSPQFRAGLNDSE